MVQQPIVIDDSDDMEEIPRPSGKGKNKAMPANIRPAGSHSTPGKALSPGNSSSSSGSSTPFYETFKVHTCIIKLLSTISAYLTNGCSAPR